MSYAVLSQRSCNRPGGGTVNRGQQVSIDGSVGRVVLTSFIPEADRRLAATGNYQIDWNAAFGSVARRGGALETVQYDLADIGIITTSFHSDKVPFYNLSYVTPFVTTDMASWYGP